MRRTAESGIVEANIKSEASLPPDSAWNHTISTRHFGVIPIFLVAEFNEPVAVLRDEPPVTEQLKSGVHKIIASSLKALSDLARARASMPVDARGLKGP